MSQFGVPRSFVSSSSTSAQKKKNKESLFFQFGYNQEILLPCHQSSRHRHRRRRHHQHRHHRRRSPSSLFAASAVSRTTTSPASTPTPTPTPTTSHILCVSRVAIRNIPAGNNVLMAAPETKTKVPTTIELEYEHLPTPHATQQTSIPRYLPRPLFRAITPEVVAAIDPVLADIPLGYILHNLKDIGPKLLEGVKATQAIPPTGPLTGEMIVQFDNTTNLEPPTHIFAVRSKDHHHGTYTLFPIHALVISTGCAHLPSLPYSPAFPPGEAPPQLTLPVVSLSIPSPPMFHPLVNYLYLRQNSVILDVLLPIEDNQVDPFIEMSKKQAEQFSIQELLINVRKIHDLWANASALGIFDPHLFTTMEFAWEICTGALSIALNEPLDSGIDVFPEEIST